MRRALRCLSAAAVIGLVPIAAWAHHGVAGYDFANPVIVEGKLVEAQWRNPHVYFTIETGVSRRLVVEASSLSAMNAFGISRKIMPAGSNVKFLVARRAKKPEANDVFGMAVVLADGSMRQLAYVRLPPSEKAGSATTLVPATGLAGHWAPASPAPMGEYAQAEGRAHGQPGQAPRADTCKGLERTPIPFATAALGVCARCRSAAAP